MFKRQLGKEELSIILNSGLLIFSEKSSKLFKQELNSISRLDKPHLLLAQHFAFTDSFQSKTK